MIGFSILLTAVAYAWLALIVTRRIANHPTKYLVISIFIFIPAWDVIPGKLYFNHLCENKAGVNVYNTVELPKYYWDEYGEPRFLKLNGDLDARFLENRFLESSSTKVYPSIFRIDKRHQKIEDNSTHEILGEVINFMYWGGWVERYLSPHNSAIDCKEFHGSEFWRDFYLGFFKPVNSN